MNERIAEALEAMVEQQRIANVIALGQVTAGDGLPPFRHHVMRPGSEHGVVPTPEIKEALGL